MFQDSKSNIETRKRDFLNKCAKKSVINVFFKVNGYY